MKKTTLIFTAMISLNAMANTNQMPPKAIDQASNIEHFLVKDASPIIALKKPTSRLLAFLGSGNNPQCALQCYQEFNACLDAGYPWNSCNWEMQACSDLCFGGF